MATKAVFIDPSATKNGNGSYSNPYNSWYSVDWGPGTAYLQKAGTVHSGAIQISAKGTATDNIFMGAYGEGAMPVFDGGLVFSGAAHLTISSFTMTGSSLAGIAVTGGSHHIKVLNSTVTDNAAGVWFSGSAGGSNTVGGSTITNNDRFGVAFDRYYGKAGQETKIDGNIVADNGSHGIDVYANNVIVTNNAVSGNGGEIPGSSGIHVHAWTPGENLGQDNTITGNVTYGNIDTNGNDGIGILLDHYTGGNLVDGNVSYENDGAGIAIYASSDNTVSNNVMFDNMKDSGNSHTVTAEFAVNTDSKLGNDLTDGNKIYGNVAISSTGNEFYIDRESEELGNIFDGNSWGGGAGGSVSSSQAARTLCDVGRPATEVEAAAAEEAALESEMLQMADVQLAADLLTPDAPVIEADFGRGGATYDAANDAADWFLFG